MGHSTSSSSFANGSEKHRMQMSGAYWEQRAKEAENKLWEIENNENTKITITSPNLSMKHHYEMLQERLVEYEKKSYEMKQDAITSERHVQELESKLKETQIDRENLSLTMTN